MDINRYGTPSEGRALGGVHCLLAKPLTGETARASSMRSARGPRPYAPACFAGKRGKLSLTTDCSSFELTRSGPAPEDNHADEQCYAQDEHVHEQR